jgi:hypothetical protein
VPAREPPPVRFATATSWPGARPSGSAGIRAGTSVAPPAAKGDDEPRLPRREARGRRSRAGAARAQEGRRRGEQGGQRREGKGDGAARRPGDGQGGAPLVSAPVRRGLRIRRSRQTAEIPRRFTGRRERLRTSKGVSELTAWPVVARWPRSCAAWPAQENRCALTDNPGAGDGWPPAPQPTVASGLVVEVRGRVPV